jgi:hypothetical protein
MYVNCFFTSRAGFAGPAPPRRARLEAFSLVTAEEFWPRVGAREKKKKKRKKGKKVDLKKLRRRHFFFRLFGAFFGRRIVQRGTTVKGDQMSF